MHVVFFILLFVPLLYSLLLTLLHKIRWNSVSHRRIVAYSVWLRTTETEISTEITTYPRDFRRTSRVSLIPGQCIMNEVFSVWRMHSLTLIGGNGRSRDGNLPDCSVHTTGSRTASQLNGTVAALIDEKWIHYRLSLLSLLVVTSEASIVLLGVFRYSLKYSFSRSEAESSPKVGLPSLTLVH